MDDTVRLINRLENDPEEYRRLVAKQRDVLHRCFFEAPMQSLRNCLDDKRSRQTPKRYTWTDRLRDRMAFIRIK